MPTGQIRALFRHRIKGLSARPLDAVTLAPGRGFPHDRSFAFARLDSGLDGETYAPRPKDRFLMLMRDERPAGLDTRFDPATRLLTICVQGLEVLAADLSVADWRAAAEAFFARMFDLPTEQAPRFAQAAQAATRSSRRPRTKAFSRCCAPRASPATALARAEPAAHA